MKDEAFRDGMSWWTKISCDFACYQFFLYHTGVELAQYVSRKAVLPQCAQEKEPLMGFLDQAGNVS